MSRIDRAYSAGYSDCVAALTSGVTQYTGPGGQLSEDEAFAYWDGSADASNQFNGVFA